MSILMAKCCVYLALQNEFKVFRLQGVNETMLIVYVIAANVFIQFYAVSTQSFM
jgi:hypothetical protein